MKPANPAEHAQRHQHHAHQHRKSAPNRTRYDPRDDDKQKIQPEQSGDQT